MILFCGIPSESSLDMVIRQTRILGVPSVVLNQRNATEMKLDFKINKGIVTGSLIYDSQQYRLEDFKAVYSRIMDFHSLPELENEPQGSAKLEYCRIQHDAFIRWCTVSPARIVNRSSAMSTNYSKPYQSQLIRKQGFLIPETLITNDPICVQEFLRQFGRVIYKSTCSIRSIVQTLTEKDLSRLNLIRLCPVQFQEFIDGIDVRVHTIGEKAFATSIHSETTDYRYAYTEGKQDTFQVMKLPNELERKCINLSNSLGLAFAGIDLKITADNKVYCLEVNPSPAFSYYENYTGQPIAQAVAKYLIGKD
jgi:glutathione synthase/RimK-type ligase-like ATP-grasp enzyme